MTHRAALATRLPDVPPSGCAGELTLLAALPRRGAAVYRCRGCGDFLTVRAGTVEAGRAGAVAALAEALSARNHLPPGPPEYQL